MPQAAAPVQYHANSGRDNIPSSCDRPMGDQNHGKGQSPESLIGRAAGVIGAVMALVFIQGGGWSHLSHRISHEKLAALHYRGEWSLGEYRECSSMNLKEEDKKPQLDCLDSAPLDAGKVFKVSFSGDLTYDEEKPETLVHFWLCRRNDAAASFSCGATENHSGDSQTPSGNEQPAKPERQLTDAELENLRKRNECQQRFYDKKIYEVDGMSIGLACKQNPDRRP